MAAYIKFWLAKSIAEVLMVIGVIGGIAAIVFIVALIQTYWPKKKRAK